MDINFAGGTNMLEADKEESSRRFEQLHFGPSQTEIQSRMRRVFVQAQILRRRQVVQVSSLQKQLLSAPPRVQTHRWKRKRRVA